MLSRARGLAVTECGLFDEVVHRLADLLIGRKAVHSGLGLFNKLLRFEGILGFISRGCLGNTNS